MSCLVSALDEHGGASGHEIVKQQLSLSGAGASGQLRAEPDTLDFSTLLVGQPRQLPLALINSSDVDLFFDLSFERTERTVMEEPGHPEVLCIYILHIYVCICIYMYVYVYIYIYIYIYIYTY